jgi:hypothetical protein
MDHDGRATLEVHLTSEHVIDDAGQREHVGIRTQRNVAREHLFGRCVPECAHAHRAKGGVQAFGACHAEVGDLEDLGLAKTAAEHVTWGQIAMDDVHRMDRDQALRKALDGVRGANRVEREPGVLNRILHALIERRPFDATVHVFDGQPRRRRFFENGRPARIDEAHDEGAGRDTLVQAAERHRLFLGDQVRCYMAHRQHGAHGFDDHGRDTRRGFALGKIGDTHGPLAQLFDEPILNTVQDL